MLGAAPQDGSQLSDWQFWAVSAIALGALLFIARPLWKPLFRLGRRGSANCPGCPSGGTDATPRAKRVDLTIGGKRVRS